MNSKHQKHMWTLYYSATATAHFFRTAKFLEFLLEDPESFIIHDDCCTPSDRVHVPHCVCSFMYFWWWIGCQSSYASSAVFSNPLGNSSAWYNDTSPASSLPVAKTATSWRSSGGVDGNVRKFIQSSVCWKTLAVCLQTRPWIPAKREQNPPQGSPAYCERFSLAWYTRKIIIVHWHYILFSDNQHSSSPVQSTTAHDHFKWWRTASFDFCKVPRQFCILFQRRKNIMPWNGVEICVG